MSDATIQKTAAGEKIRAGTINSLIDAVPDIKVFGDGRLDQHGNQINITVGNRSGLERVGQKFRMPFDLSTSNCVSGATELSVSVIRSHFPNDTGGFDDVGLSEDPMVFPAEDEVKVYLCELSTGGRKIIYSSDDEISAAKTKKTLWTLNSKGVVLEDSRIAALGGGGGQIGLDLSSLNWVQVSSEGEGGETVWSDSVSAQLWDYGRLQEGDIADKAELTANNGWMFPVRPPDGLPHLQYVELSTMQEVVGGGGGGGGCSCDLSVTPPATLSSLGQDLVQIADWTKDGWQTHVPILAPDVAKDVIEIYNRMAMTPFWYNEPTHQIRNNYFYNGRTYCAINDFTVQQGDTYYLKIEDNIYGVAPSFTIIHSSNAPNVMSNTDTVTYYPLWTINAQLKAAFDWRLTWMLPRYSN